MRVNCSHLAIRCFSASLRSSIGAILPGIIIGLVGLHLQIPKVHKILSVSPGLRQSTCLTNSLFSITNELAAQIFFPRQ